MAFEKEFKSYPKAYHKIVECVFHIKSDKLCIVTDIFNSKEESANRINRIGEQQYVINKKVIEHQCLSIAEKYYFENSSEVESAYKAALDQRMEVIKKDIIQKGNTPPKKIIVAKDKRDALKKQVLNRLVAQKAEHYADEIYKEIWELKDKIIKTNYEILQKTLDFCQADAV